MADSNPRTALHRRSVQSTETQCARIRRTLFVLGTGFTAAHSMQLGTLMASLAYATNDLRTAFWAFFIQQAIEPVTELATSYFADRRGRRKSVCLGFSALALAGGGFMAVTGLVPAGSDLLLPLVALAQLAYLLGTSFISGALEAWAVDSLHGTEEREVDLDALFTRLNLFQNIGIVAGGGVGILILILSARAWAPWILFSAATLSLGWLAWREMGRTERQDRALGAGHAPTLSSALGRIWLACRSNRNLAIYILGWALQYGFWGILAYFWVPLLLVGMETASLHHWAWAVSAWIVWSVVRIAAASVAVRSVRTGVLSAERIITLCAFATIIPIIVYLAFKEMLGPIEELAVFFVAILLSKAFEVAMTGLRMGRLNTHIGDAGLRATFISLGYAAGAFTTLLILGASMLVLEAVPSEPRQILWLLGINAVAAGAGAVVYAMQNHELPLGDSLR